MIAPALFPLEHVQILNMENINIQAADGYLLSALYNTPAMAPKAVVVISSATGIKKEFYINFSNYLLHKGYTVLLYDYRGIGGSVYGKLNTLKATMHEWGTKDMNAVLQYLRNKNSNTDIIWVGHSVGAQLIGFLNSQHQVKKVIAINSALGYWGYFPFPVKWLIWGLWYFVGPAMVMLYGYGRMRLIGWGENLTANMMQEWRSWCLDKTYFRNSLMQVMQQDKFYQFTVPITAVYTSDDFIANDVTVPLMMAFFPNAPQKILKLPVHEFTREKVGHTGIFRKKFSTQLWPWLADVIEKG